MKLARQLERVQTDDAGLYTINLTSEDFSEENLTVVAVVTAGGKDYRSPATPDHGAS